MKRFIIALALIGCSIESPGSVVHESSSESFSIAPLESLDYAIPEHAVAWRLAGNPNRSSSPFVETMWYWLAADDGNNIDFFRGDELGADRLTPISVGSAASLKIDNAGGSYVAGAVIWNLEIER